MSVHTITNVSTSVRRVGRQTLHPGDARDFEAQDLLPNDLVEIQDGFLTAVPPIPSDVFQQEQSKVKVSSNDTDSNFLDDKVSAAAPITLTVNNDGADEDLEIGIDLGSTPGTAAAGNDARFPTTAQKDALAGTSGAPNSGNPYVTDSDPRIPTLGEKAALVGTDGTPGALNPFVTDSDPRLGGGSITLEDEGTPIAGAPHSILNFVGANVSVADAGGGEATITVTGGGGGGDDLNIATVGPTGDYTTIAAALAALEPAILLQRGTHSVSGGITAFGTTHVFGMGRESVISFSGTDRITFGPALHKNFHVDASGYTGSIAAVSVATLIGSFGASTCVFENITASLGSVSGSTWSHGGSGYYNNIGIESANPSGSIFSITSGTIVTNLDLASQDTTSVSTSAAALNMGTDSVVMNFRVHVGGIALPTGAARAGVNVGTRAYLLGGLVTGFQSGIRMTGTDSTVQACTVLNHDIYGVWITSGTNIKVLDMRGIQKRTTAALGSIGIYAPITGAITGFEISRNRILSGVMGISISSVSASTGVNVSDNMISASVANDIMTDGIRVTAGSSLSHVTLRGNKFTTGSFYDSSFVGINIFSVTRFAALHNMFPALDAGHTGVLTDALADSYVIKDNMGNGVGTTVSSNGTNAYLLDNL